MQFHEKKHTLLHLERKKNYTDVVTVNSNNSDDFIKNSSNLGSDNIQTPEDIFLFINLKFK